MAFAITASKVKTQFRPISQALLVTATREAATPASRVPVLMIHGAFHGWWAYERWLGLFAACGFSASALSLRGHEGGRPLSPQERCAVTMDDYVCDVEAAIEEIGAPVVLIGHSLGGLMAQMAAAKRGDIRGLALIGSAGPAELGATRDFSWPEDEPLLFPPERMRRSMFHQIEDGDFAAIYGRLVPESPRALNESALAKISIPRHAIKAPILVVGTQYDGIGLHSGQSIADHYGADFVSVPGTSHDCLLEDAGLDAAHEVLRWLLKNRLDVR